MDEEDFSLRTPRNSEPGAEELRMLLEETRTVLVRTQRRNERNEQQIESLSRRVMALGAVLVMLAIGLGLLTWYELRMQL